MKSPRGNTTCLGILAMQPLSSLMSRTDALVAHRSPLLVFSSTHAQLSPIYTSMVLLAV